jgi:hypothetical protein
VCYDSVDDETRMSGHVLCDIGLVDWRATKREERGVGRGWDWELAAWGNDWRSFLVVLIAPAQKREPGTLWEPRERGEARTDVNIVHNLSKMFGVPGHIQRNVTEFTLEA